MRFIGAIPKGDIPQLRTKSLRQRFPMDSGALLQHSVLCCSTAITTYLRRAIVLSAQQMWKFIDNFPLLLHPGPRQLKVDRQLFRCGFENVTMSVSAVRF